MTAHELLAQLREKGVEVKTSGDDRLVIDAPKGTITEELRSALSAHKAELLQILKAEQTETAEPAIKRMHRNPPLTPCCLESEPRPPSSASEFAIPAPERMSHRPAAEAYCLDSQVAGRSLQTG